jgi:DNA-binding NarL/FixJ family response regulator
VTNGNQTYSQVACRTVRVDGVLPRDSPGRAFVNCIEDVIRNQQSRDVERDDARDAQLARAKTPYGLTRREAEIVCAVADCASNKHIAAQLSIAEDTVKHHLSRIFNKVGVDSRLELAVFALYHGIAPWS